MKIVISSLKKFKGFNKPSWQFNKRQFFFARSFRLKISTLLPVERKGLKCSRFKYLCTENWFSSHYLADFRKKIIKTKNYIWAFFGIAFLWDWNENWHFPALDHCWIFQICWHIECSTFTASAFRIWNSSTGIPSPPLALFIVILPKTHLT